MATIVSHDTGMTRPGRKLGFSAPVDRRFGRWVHAEAEAYLLRPWPRTPAFLREGPIRQLLTAVRDRRLSRARQLIGLYVLESWLRGPASAVARA